MAEKIGRNEQCPCGSGKKYKLCCLNSKPRHSVVSQIERDDKRYPPIDQEKHPDPLIHGYLKQEIYTIAFTYREPLPKYGTSPRPEGYPGEYVVEFTLQPPSRLVMDEAHWSTDADMLGGSLVAIAKPLPREGDDIAGIHVDVGLPSSDGTQQVISLRYRFISNSEGFLSTIKVNLMAQSVVDADHIASKHLDPILCQWAFVHDVPLDIARIRTEEVATKTCQTRYTRQAYLKVPANTAFFSGLAPMPEHYHPLVFYREALSATNPLYQYLCFYKVVELIMGLRRARVIEARKAGTSPSVVTERLTRNAWLIKNVEASLLNEVDGKTFTAIRDDVLRPQRHRIAHAFLDDESPTASPAEELLNPANVYRLLPLIKDIARTMVMNEMDIKLPA